MSQGALRNYIRVIGAGIHDSVKATGNFVRLVDAQGGSVTVQTDSGDRFTLQEGEAARLTQAFDEVAIVNDSSVERRVVLLIGRGDFTSQQLTGSVAPKPAGTLQAVGDIAGGGTVPANPDRRQLVIRAATGNAGALTLAGIPLDPGDVFEVDITGSIAVGGAGTDLLHVAEVI